jgi:branched-subunit amino acid aminotransferase/4-amino-4-deoxychorismate lyase
VPDREGWLRYRTKSGNYLDMILALDTAMRAGADEALLVDRRGRILEGARTNIFVVMSDGIATPPVRLGILPGIMRALALGWARREGIPAAVRSVTYRSMRRAREAFVTNCVWGIMPVRSVDEHPLGTRVPGPITRRLMERHDRWAQRGT